MVFEEPFTCRFGFRLNKVVEAGIKAEISAGANNHWSRKQDEEIQKQSENRVVVFLNWHKVNVKSCAPEDPDISMSSSHIGCPDNTLIPGINEVEV